MEPTTRSINPNLYTPLAIVIAGIIIGAAVVWENNAHSAPATAGAQPAATVTVDASKVKTAGEPFIGNANAPVTIAYWFDYQCPYCKQNEQTAMPQLISDYVNTGKAKIIFKDFSFLGADSDTLGHAGRAVWAVAPDKFYAWHKAIYDNQGEENTGWATTAVIQRITATVLTSAQTAQVMQLMTTDAKAYQAEMDADKTEGASFGITGTPSLIVGNQLVEGAVPYAQIKSAVDAAVATAK